MRSALVPMLAVALAGVACKPVESTSVTGYLDTIPIFWDELYTRGGETLYCGERFGAQRSRDTNIEHVFPMSWVARELGCGDRDACRLNSERFNGIEADMHNLYPALRRFNQLRGARPFGNIKGEARKYGACDFELSYRPSRVEPRPAMRGEIARAMLYMADRYQMPIYKKQLAMLKDWHRRDQPSKEERRRNDVIERLQGRRNPFIDDPDLVSRVRQGNSD